MERKDVGLRIAKIRIEKGLSAYELSKRIAKSFGYIHAVETGKTNPSVDTILDIAQELGVHPSEFFKK